MILTVEKSEPGDGEEFDIKGFRTAFEAAMNDDFNSAQAIAVLFETLKELRKRINEGKTPSNLDAVKIFLHSVVEEVLGIWPQENNGGNEELATELIEFLIEIRNDVRSNKNFELSDKIRDELKEMGVQLMDGKQGTTFEIE